jgi:hypothetical protein
MDILIDILWRWLSKQAEKPSLWVLTLCLIVFGLAYRAWRCRIRKGDYKINSTESDFTFESKLGKFIFNKEKKSFIAHYFNNKEIVLSFDEILNIKVITEDIDAMFSEIAFEGWDFLIDTLPEYRDVVKKYSIAVITKNFQRYPLIVMSQYTIKDFWAWGLQIQLDLLSIMRWYTPIDMYTQEIYEKFKNFLNQEFSFK